MNNAKMWLVVKPTVGVPLFLTAVAVGSFAVHVSVLRNTTWLPQFLSGGAAMEQASIHTPGIVPTGGNATVVFDGVQQVGTGQQGVVCCPMAARLVSYSMSPKPSMAPKLPCLNRVGHVRLCLSVKQGMKAKAGACGSRLWKL
jgi:light-harvesting protein B-800-850 alpha chain